MSCAALRWLRGGLPVFLALLVSPLGRAEATVTSWKLYDREQAHPVARFAGGPHQILCGGYGVFEMDLDASPSGESRTSSIPTRDEGREIPPDYPLLTSEAPRAILSTASGSQGRGKSPHGGRLGQGTVPLPCADGACFSAPGSGLWVAVVDWDNWHGWGVGQTLLTASGGAVSSALFALDDPTLARFFGQRVTDVHLLAQLCHIAEAMEDPGIEPPVAVTMSLGRIPGTGEKRDGKGGCDPSTLACQISRVLDHLQTRSAELAPERANPTILLASAGNHGTLLFPASHERVISVGALDLQIFHRYGSARPAWETPVSAQALFPAHGLCLEYTTGTGQEAAWPAPPGSSFATALMTGWLSPALESQPLPDGRGRWAAARVCRGRRCTYVATRGGRAYGRTGSGAQKLARGTDQDQETPCGASSQTSDEVILRATVGSPRPLSALPSHSLPQALPALLLPTPAPASCVPCEERLRLNRSQGLQLAPAGDSLQDPALSGLAGASHKPRAESLAIQLWAGRAMDPSLVLSELHLRIESTLLPVKLRRADLNRLEDGEIGILEIDLGRYGLPKQTQPSLVWSLRAPHASGGELELWTSSPILFRSK